MTTIDEYAAGFTDDAGYLDFARFGPMGNAVLTEQAALSEIQARSRFGSEAVFDEQDIRVREAVSRATGFSPDQVVFQPNTSMGLMHTMLGLSGGILLSSREYPSLPVAAQRASQALHVLEPQFVDPPEGVMTPAVVRDALTDSTAIVAVSLVDYDTGYLADLEGIRQVIGDRLLIVDAIQGFGVVEAPYELADVVVSGGQKWMRAGWGTGFLALSERASSSIVPVVSGVAGTILDLGSSYETVPPPLEGAAAFQITRHDPIAQGRFATALEEIAEVGVGAVNAVVADRVGRLIDLVDEFGIPIVSSRVENERAGIVVLEPDADQITALQAAFINHEITATIRNGRVRLSAHVCTGEATFEVLRGALTSFASGLTY